MRNTFLLCCGFIIAAVLPGAAEQAAEPDRQIRKGDNLSVKGCLSGTSLAATETSAPDTTALLAEGLTFRLTGDKALLKQLREKHDRRLVEVRGILKSNLPQAGSQSRSLGGMRIGIGAAPPSAGRPEAEARRALPVLEVKAFDGGTTYCGR